MNPNAISAAFINYARLISANITPYTLDLLWLLASIELIWIGLEIARSRPIEDVLDQVLRWILCTGLFYAVIINADTWIADIITGFAVVGQRLTGIPNLDPMTILNLGTQLVETVWGAPSGVGLTSSLTLALGQLFAAGWILLCFGLIGAVALYLVIEAWLLVAGGKILLAFGVNRWTSSIPEGYISHSIGCGVALLFMYILVGAGGTLIPTFVAHLNAVCVPTTVTTPWWLTYGIPPGEVMTTTCSAPLPARELIILMLDSLILFLLCCGLPWQARRMIQGAIGSELAHIVEGMGIGATISRFSRAIAGAAAAPLAAGASMASRAASAVAQPETLASSQPAAPLTRVTPPPAAPTRVRATQPSPPSARNTTLV